MTRLRIFLSKLFFVVSLSFGAMPRVVALLELWHTPAAARVMLYRRRRLAYTEFFTLLDRDGRRAAPIARSAAAAGDAYSGDDVMPHERYIRVDAA